MNSYWCIGTLVLFNFGVAITLSSSRQFSENLKSLPKVSGGAGVWTKVIWCVSLCSSSPVSRLPGKIQDSQLNRNFFISTNNVLATSMSQILHGTYFYYKYLLFIWKLNLFGHPVLSLLFFAKSGSPTSVFITSVFLQVFTLFRVPHCASSFGLLTLSYSVQAAVTKYHRLGGLQTTCLFLTVPEAGKSKIKELANSESGEGLL